jgi:hypothetical protein
MFLLGEELLWFLKFFECKQGFRVGVGGFFCNTIYWLLAIDIGNNAVLCILSISEFLV